MIKDQRTCLYATALSTAILLVMLLASSESVSGSNIGEKTPAAPKIVAAGQSQFLHLCSGCHGADAQGGDGPNLHKQGLAVAFITSRITLGVKDEMPAFTKLSPVQITELVSYVMSLQ